MLHMFYGESETPENTVVLKAARAAQDPSVWDTVVDTGSLLPRWSPV